MEIIICLLWKGGRGLLETQMLCLSEFSFSRRNESGWLFSPAGPCLAQLPDLSGRALKVRYQTGKWVCSDSDHSREIFT